MQLKIKNGAVDLSGKPILTKIDFEINDHSRIAVVGRNGCGKTTLLKLIAGEYTLNSDNPTNGSMFTVSGNTKIGTLSQVTFSDESVTLVDEIRSAYGEILALKDRLEDYRLKMEQTQSEDAIKSYTDLLDVFTNMGGFYFEKEYEAAIKKFGFTKEERLKPVSEFSGGQRTKIAFLKLLLSKPDILLLDEPTNHLDIEAISWLEDYLKNYKKAFVVVSHDRMFLDNVANIVYEIEYGVTHCYHGNYTDFVRLKKQETELQTKKYNEQQKEIAETEALIERFRYKATKAAMVQSKIKQLEKMERIAPPQRADTRTFHTDFTPDDLGVTDVLSVKDLTIGYTAPLSTVSLDVKRGERIGIIGGNGLGKSTFLKTIMGALPPISGEFSFGTRVNIGYFEQQLAQYNSDDTVFDNFKNMYPALTDFEARSALGAFMFSEDEIFTPVNKLSGGERVRLALCKIFMKKPNCLILDEPTNHLDMIGKEVLEDILARFTGTVIFVSHDRYFVKKIAEQVLLFEGNTATLYRHGYEQYLASQNGEPLPQTEADIQAPKQTKKVITPGKLRSKTERALQKAEEKIALLEKKIDGLKTERDLEENQSDYIKLSEISEELENLEIELDIALTEWDNLSTELEKIKNGMS